MNSTILHCKKLPPPTPAAQQTLVVLTMEITSIHKLGLNKILGTIHSYPTMAEANKFAAGNWKKANKPEKLLSYVGKYHAWRRG